VLLFAVMFLGDISMGAQRWLDLGVVRFQPSEIMKLAVPLACAWFLHERPLPPSFTSLAIVGVAIGLPTLLIAGDLDFNYILTRHEGLSEDLPNAFAAIIEGTAHLPNLDAPREYNQLMSGFARRHLPAAA